MTARVAAPGRVGPYELVALLGDGGMGVVHRARDLATGEIVALKMVKVPEAGRADAIRREIAALRRLSHPGIARILESGSHEGMPWYAMRLEEGRSLREHLQRAGAPSPAVAHDAPTNLLPPDDPSRTDVLAGLHGSPLRRLRPAAAAPLPAVLGIVRRLCAPLRYLHGEGIVHRDLKPANVVVSGAGAPVIIDFGLATVSGAELAREEIAVTLASGTAGYMAPEQSRGEQVDARADLYALGCILYELLTGRLPFEGRMLHDVLRQQRDRRPEPPSALVADLPEALDDLVLALLEREPSRRPGYADDVAAALATLGAAEGGDEAGAPARPYVYRPRLAGREEVVAELAASLGDLASRRRGGVFLLTAQSGLGKTRLVTEVASRAAQGGVDVLAGACDARSREPLLGLRGVLALVADRCREGGLAETEAILGPRGKLLAPYEPSLLGLPGQERHPDPPPLAEGAGKARLHGALRTTLLELAARVPTLLVVEDAQWADELTMGFLLHLARGAATAPAPLAAIVTARSEEPSAPLAELAAHARCLALAPLSPAQVRDVVADMLAMPDPPEGLAGAMARESEGNPLFVAEYLRSAVAAGLLARDARGRFVATEGLGRGVGLPATLRGLIGERLGALSEDARAVMEAASVLGGSLDVAVLLLMLELPAERSLEAWGELVARQVVEEAPRATPRFSHAKVRDVAYDALAPAARRALHAAAARATEALHGGRRDADLERLARHWEEAGELADARECWLASARAAYRRYAHDVADAGYRRYLELSDEGSAARSDARWERALYVLHRRGRSGEAERECRRAVEEAEGPGDLIAAARALRALSSIHHDTGELEAAAAELGRARELAVGDPALQATCCGNLANVRKAQGRLRSARELYLEAIARSRDAGGRAEEGVWRGNLAGLLMDEGSFADALAQFEEALAAARDGGQRRIEGVWLGNRGMLLRDLGCPEDARASFEEALRIAREIEDPRSEAIWHGGLGSLALAVQDAGAARDSYARALELSRGVGDRRHEGYCLVGLAFAEELAARPAPARDALSRAAAIAAEVGDARLLAMVLIRGAWLGILEEAPAAGLERDLERAAELLEAAGDRTQPLQVACARGHLALREGQSATASLEEARRCAAPWAGHPAGAGMAAVARLARAQGLHEAGRGALVRGHDPADLSSAQRRAFGC